MNITVDNVSVCLSGPCLAFAIKDCEKTHIKEGFLVGKVEEIQTQHITDTDSSGTKLTKYIKINSVIPIIYADTFYNGYGRVDAKKLKKITFNQNIVGWFISKKEEKSPITLRQKTIHCQLSKHFQNHYFLMCIFSKIVNSLQSCISYEQTCYIYNKSFKSVSVKVANVASEKSSYIMSDCYNANSINQIIDKVESTEYSGVNNIKNIQHALEENMDLRELQKTEEEREVLEIKVLELFKIINSHNLEQIEMYEGSD